MSQPSTSLPAALYTDSDTGDHWASSLPGDIVRPDCSPEERNLWLAVVKRALMDRTRETYLSDEDKRSLNWFMFCPKANTHNLRWIADHLSGNPDKFCALFRRAFSLGWEVMDRPISKR